MQLEANPETVVLALTRRLAAEIAERTLAETAATELQEQLDRIANTVLEADSGSSTAQEDLRDWAKDRVSR